MRKNLFIGLLFSFIALAATEKKDFQLIFQKANQLQQSSQFEDALKYYQDLEASNFQSEVLFYNMGNCYYHLKKWGYARAYFEKSLKLNPMDEATMINLNLTLKEIEGVHFQKRSLLDNPVNFLTQYYWLLCVMCFTILGVILFFIFKFSLNEKLKKTSLIFFVLNGIFLIFALIGYFSYFFEEKEGIILHNSDVYENPIERSDVLKNVTLGQKVKVLEKMEDWTQVQRGKNIFWIKSKDVMTLQSF